MFEIVPNCWLRSQSTNQSLVLQSATKWRVKLVSEFGCRGIEDCGRPNAVRSFRKIIASNSKTVEYKSLCIGIHVCEHVRSLLHRLTLARFHVCLFVIRIPACRSGSINYRCHSVWLKFIMLLFLLLCLLPYTSVSLCSSVCLSACLTAYLLVYTLSSACMPYI